MLKHIAVGLFIPYCVFMVIYVRKGFHAENKTLAALPFILLFCGIWSFAPNIMGKLPLFFLSKIFNNFFISNIFFFHGILARTGATGSTFGLGLIFVMFFSLMFIFARHLGAQEKDITDLRKRRV